jgi:hypothetical protein
MRKIAPPDPEAIAIIGALILAALALLAEFVSWLAHP